MKLDISWKVLVPLLGAFVIGGLNGLVPVIPQPWAALIMALLPVAAGYFHVDEVKKAQGLKK